MRFVNFAIVKFSLFLTLGIVAGYYTSSNYFLGLGLLAVSVVVLFLSWFFFRKSIYPNYLFGVFTFICFFLIGYVNYKTRLPGFQKNHISHILKKDTFQLVHVKIKEVLKPNDYRQNYIAIVFKVDTIHVSGKILVSVKKDSAGVALQIDDEVLLFGKITEIAKAKNPYVFDYSSYMKKLGVYNQISVTHKTILNHQRGSPTIRGKMAALREHIILKLKQNHLAHDELAIIEALILGQRKDIRKDLYTSYTNAGATHILAVSGLHVGIMLLLISFVLKPVNYFKHGKTIALVLTVIFLWGFALLAGLSASVTRAVTMFSFLVLAQLLNRETNAINTLFLSYFFLLLLNPLWLFQVGFQLSYVAVFFILWVHPKLYAYYRPNNYLGRLFWGIFTITLVVQIGVFPLLLYYFHQFPLVSFVTNLVILPFLGVILGLGVIIIVLALVNFLPQWLSIGYEYIIKWLNKFVLWIGSQEDFIITHISVSIYKLLALYFLIIAVILFWKNRKPNTLIASLLGIVLLLTVSIVEKYQSQTSQLVIFHTNRATTMAYKNGRTLQVYASDTLKNYKIASPVSAYSIGLRINQLIVGKIPSVFKYREKLIVVIDSFGVYPSGRVDVVVLTNSPKIHLERLIDSINPELLIADGSNYTGYVRRWKKTCKKRKLPFHYTGTKGAFILE